MVYFTIMTKLLWIQINNHKKSIKKFINLESEWNQMSTKFRFDVDLQN